MFENLPQLPADPILGLMDAFRNDSNPNKIDLGVGVYKTEQGATPVLESVKLAERDILELEQTKLYIGPAGAAEFGTAIQNLLLGENHPALADNRVSILQTPGGCGAAPRARAKPRRAGRGPAPAFPRHPTGDRSPGPARARPWPRRIDSA